MARNTLTQRTFGPVCSAYTCLESEGMKEGDFAGICLLQKKYGLTGIRIEGGKTFIVMVNADTGSPVEMQRIPISQKVVYIKAECDFRNRADLAYFYYSLDGRNWVPIGNQLRMEYTLMEHFMGYRFGLFNYATKNTGGYADFDFFKISNDISIQK
jgi:beta-xylosidase